MTHLVYKCLCFIFCVAALMVTLSCGHDHSAAGHSHDDAHAHDDHAHGSQTAAAHDDHDDHDDHDHGKTVHLNPAQYKHADIDTGWFEMKNLSDVVKVNGYTKLDPQDEAEVSMPISGTIQGVKVIEGNYVKKGQTLATMSSLDYSTMLLEKSKLSEELGTSEAQLVYLEQDYARQQSLAEKNINAQKVFQKASADLNAEKSKIAAVKQQMQILDQTLGSISASGSPSISITAPISGYITGHNVKIGSIVSPDKLLFAIANTRNMHVDLLVYAKDLDKVKVGQTVRFILTNQSNKEIKGEIYNIGKSFASDTKSVAVHADIEKNDANLIPGMYINALIDIGSNKVQTLPEGAVVFAEG